jgi:transcription antitermination protein NusB
MTAEDESAASARQPSKRAGKGNARSDARAQLNQRRHYARELALQTLYEVDVSGHGIGEVLARTRASETVNEDALSYLSTLMSGIEVNRHEIDGFIAEAAPAFPVAQLPPIDRGVLRVAIFELLHMPNVPPKVAINEAVDLAKRFGGDNSGRFVNGVLGTVFKRIEADRAATG